LVLFSGGLDSILACKVLQEQGIKVTAIKCITPFFSYELKDDERAREYKEVIRNKYGIDVEVVDITPEYLSMITDPPHGYGRYLNPCIDCKILMVKKAMSLMDRYGASFLATGEVLGQRPMSQRRDTLRIIERDSGADGLLLRPLSARFLKPTSAEESGVVDRSMLPEISGRSRKEQIRLAEHYGIKDYPAPAGGCVLADPILSKRFKRIFYTWPDFGPEDCVLGQVGRHFMLPGGSWLVVGRNRAENQALATLIGENDYVLKVLDCPGPLCIARRVKDKSDLVVAASICARYAKVKSLPVTIGVGLRDEKGQNLVIDAIPEDNKIHSYMF